LSLLLQLLEGQRTGRRQQRRCAVVPLRRGSTLRARAVRPLVPGVVSGVVP
jgi:hypothetical protein